MKIKLKSSIIPYLEKITMYFLPVFQTFLIKIESLLSSMYIILLSCLFYCSLYHEHLSKDSELFHHCIIFNLPAHKKSI